ncbi:phage virion morphogenesis protein [Lachnospiraceae bacterium MD308]|nr:phage virion morphogenesis protein [Lachnospiraceae bacterium MD308]
MSSIRAELSGDTEQLLGRLKQLSSFDRAGVLNAIAEGLRTSTMERFSREQSPEGVKWAPSVRAGDSGGKTLTQTAALKNSIRAKSDDSGAAVGTNDIRAATHQFGDTRTIRAKNSKYLTFQIGGKWVRKASVTIHIPARPFLGISQEDQEEIRELLEEAIEE